MLGHFKRPPRDFEAAKNVRGGSSGPNGKLNLFCARMKVAVNIIDQEVSTARPLYSKPNEHARPNLPFENRASENERLALWNFKGSADDKFGHRISSGSKKIAKNLRMLKEQF
jgi:hypothetical protein